MILGVLLKKPPQEYPDVLKLPANITEYYEILHSVLEVVVILKVLELLKRGPHKFSYVRVRRVLYMTECNCKNRKGWRGDSWCRQRKVPVCAKVVGKTTHLLSGCTKGVECAEIILC